MHPVVISLWDTRAQRKHLALEGLGRELVRKVADVGAEVGVLSTWEVRPGMVGNPARQELAFSTMSEGRTDAPAGYAGAQSARRL